MRNKIEYEWTIEEIENDNIKDISFFDRIEDIGIEDFKGNDIGLVRNEGNENEGVNGRYWAYIKNGKLPKYFNNADGEETNIKVPIKFHNQINKHIQ